MFAVDCVNKTAPIVEYQTPYEMIRTTNVKGGFIDLDEVRYVTEEVFEKWTRRSRPAFGDVVLTREAPVGEVGRCTFSDRNIFLGQRLFHYRPDPAKLDWNYLAYVLQSWEVQGRLRGMGFGATVHHVKVGDAENLMIPCPPLAVQKKIGDKLAAYDDLIENNRRRIALLEEAARLLYREWFVHLRFPGHEHVRITDGLPKGWERPTFGEIAELKYGKALKQESRVEGTSPVYGSSGIVGNHQAALVEGPSIIVGRKGNVGSVFWSPVDFWPIDTVYFIPKEQADFWLYLALPSAGFQNTDAGVPGLNRDFAYSRRMIRPPAHLRRHFNEAVEPMFKQRTTLETYNQKLAQARDLLLPHLMNGEIVV
ncbi:MAG: restriction endonuclease subunit S [Spiribacter salinus]|uniref:Restriction endonuclease subunit S n=1 Tax=Spiribacter salinus TaxID=1335746 RepID=A0A540VP26_9GAMM|nr:MAG: restriction endonuclease subunit S [Spiribacter salinus]